MPAASPRPPAIPPVADDGELGWPCLGAAGVAALPGSRAGALGAAAADLESAALTLGLAVVERFLGLVISGLLVRKQGK